MPVVPLLLCVRRCYGGREAVAAAKGAALGIGHWRDERSSTADASVAFVKRLGRAQALGNSGMSAALQTRSSIASFRLAVTSFPSSRSEHRSIDHLGTEQIGSSRRRMKVCTRVYPQHRRRPPSPRNGYNGRLIHFASEIGISLACGSVGGRHELRSSLLGTDPFTLFTSYLALSDD